jgi:HEAT repeat protein
LYHGPLVALGDAKKKKSLTDVVAQLRSDNETDRLQAVKSLGCAAIGDTVVREAIMESGGVQILVTMLSDPSLVVQEAAASALGSIALSSMISKQSISLQVNI